MRKYERLSNEKLEKIICNQCGKEIKIEQERIIEGTCHLDIAWGYFSNKDTQKHSIDLCEDCYDNWIKTFAVPVTVTEENELL